MNVEPVDLGHKKCGQAFSFASHLHQA